MMRKVVDVAITAEGRDFNKIFVLTEMPASQAERWATRLLLAITKSGVEVPDNIVDMGMQGLAALGVRALAGVRYDEIGPLMDEMFMCVQIRQPIGVRALVEEDIQEVVTRLKLRAELIALHTGFFLPGFLSTATPVKQ